MGWKKGPPPAQHNPVLRSGRESYYVRLGVEYGVRSRYYMSFSWGCGLFRAIHAARTHLVVIYQLTCAAGRMVFVMQVYDGVTGLFHLFLFLLSIAAVELNTVIAFTLYRIVGIYGVSCCA